MVPLAITFVRLSEKVIQRLDYLEYDPDAAKDLLEAGRIHKPVT